MSKRKNQTKVVYDLTKPEIIKEGQEKGYITIKENRIYYNASGKSYNFNDPEEKVRAHVYLELINKYKYLDKKIEPEVYPPRRIPKLPADLVVYYKDKNKCFIVVETKANERKLQEAKREGLGNATLLDGKYLWIVCGNERVAYDVQDKPSLKELDKYRITDIPAAYGEKPEFKYKKGDTEWELRKASFDELKNKFQRCHDAIWQGGKLDPAQAFDEMSKLLFTKYFDELWYTNVGKYYGFQVGSGEDVTLVGKRIREIFNSARRRKEKVFVEEINVPDLIIYKVVKLLENVSLRDTDLDAKGRAFETFLGDIFRGKMGQFFTNRNIVRFMVELLDPDIDDIVIDPACGSGGFLLYAWDYVKEKLTRTKDPREFEHLDWEFSHKQIFGIEKNDRIARVAMMNMVIHKDGSSNIECNDALSSYENFDPKLDIRHEKYSFLLTNPPFGAKVEEEGILSQLEMGSKQKKRKNQRTEILFIERCLDLLKPGGKMGIVLPDGILGNPTLKYVRNFVKSKARILAVVSLPSHAFTPSGVPTINSSLLFLQKENRTKHNDYKVFMAFAQNIGYDPTGRKTVKEGGKTDFDHILLDWKRFKKGEKLTFPNDFVLSLSQIQDRLDARYYWFFRELKKRKFKRIKLREFVKELKIRIDPRKDTSQYYPLLSVLNDGSIRFNEEKLGSEIKQKYKIVHAGNIAYNPYRVNIGSIGIVPQQLDGMLVSPAYIVMEVNGIEPEYILAIIRHPFYKIYLDVLATGSIRNLVNFKTMTNIEIVDPNEYNKLKKNVIEGVNKVNNLKTQINKEIEIVSKNISKIVD